METKILVAEDETHGFDVIQHFLSLEGFSILWVKTGIDAINSCATDSTIALVIMDGSMPRMNGFDAAKEIKNQHPSLPIICISANEIPDGYQKYFVAHNPKPIDPETLLVSIRTAIR